ncbi:hypothetical protein CTAYLR_007207 [Chrysophaeum taylorii]|uniref:AAA+ ATPase domain-containing protein n=1 Tax=Chrysophaeum taylorii TaxID=2483200 RepID=A0AAD7XPU4_9STRA|nr:hypothetical protein CTAYLR_007207 [Chrysophaeum taylorii]
MFAVDRRKVARDRILMHPSDMRSMGLVAGELVVVAGVLTMSVWPSRDVRPSRVHCDTARAQVMVQRRASTEAPKACRTVTTKLVRGIGRLAHKQLDEDAADATKRTFVDLASLAALTVLDAGQAETAIARVGREHAALLSTGLKKADGKYLFVSTKGGGGEVVVVVDEDPDSASMGFPSAAALQSPGSNEISLGELASASKAAMLKRTQQLEPAAAPRVVVVVGLDRTKELLRRSLDDDSGVLLYGPPGCSKTLLARAVASESNHNFVPLRGVLSKWLGESEREVRRVFRDARKRRPSVVFIDEVDAIASHRDTAAAHARVTTQLLVEIDAGGVAVIAATNRPDRLDPALLRPGRIDRLVYCPPPDRPAAAAILKAPVELDPRFSAAELVGISRRAALLAIERGEEEVTDHLIRLVGTQTTPVATEAVLHFYRAWATAVTTS